MYRPQGRAWRGGVAPVTYLATPWSAMTRPRDCGASSPRVFRGGGECQALKGASPPQGTPRPGDMSTGRGIRRARRAGERVRLRRIERKVRNGSRKEGLMGSSFTQLLSIKRKALAAVAAPTSVA